MVGPCTLRPLGVHPPHEHERYPPHFPVDLMLTPQISSSQREDWYNQN